MSNEHASEWLRNKGFSITDIDKDDRILKSRRCCT